MLAGSEKILKKHFDGPGKSWNFFIFAKEVMFLSDFVCLSVCV